MGALAAVALASVTVRCKGPVEYRPDGRLIFTDEVRLEADEMKIECDRLVAELDEESEPRRLRAEGDVKAAGEWFESTSPRAEYDFETKELRAAGPVKMRLTRDGKAIKLECSGKASLLGAEKTGLIEGDCAIELDAAKLFADRIEFAYSEDKRQPLERASASNARVEFEGKVGRAERAVYEGEGETIELQGHPVLEAKKVSLSAPGMRIHLRERRVEPVGGEFRASTK